MWMRVMVTNLQIALPGSGKSATTQMSFHIHLAQNPPVKYRLPCVAAWKHRVRMLPTVLPFSCGHFSVPLASTPSGLTCYSMAWWRNHLLRPTAVYLLSGRIPATDGIDLELVFEFWPVKQ